MRYADMPPYLRNNLTQKVSEVSIDSTFFSSGITCLDTETDVLNSRSSKLRSLQLYSGMSPRSYYSDWSNTSRFLLQQINVPIVGHNLKFDLKVLHRHGVDLTHLEWWDTLHLHHLLDENSPHDLDFLCKKYFDDAYKATFWAKYQKYEEAPESEARAYACKDVIYTLKLFFIFLKELEERGQLELATQTMRLARLLLKTEIDGISIDLGYLQKISGELTQALQNTRRCLRECVSGSVSLLEMEYWEREVLRLKEKHPSGKKWRTLPKPTFNFSSSQQLQDLLYKQLKLTVHTNYKTKKPTVDDEALEKLEHEHPVISKIRDLRTYEKMYGTFVEGIQSHSEGGILYPEFNVSGTKTGRISHLNPNLGQIPSRDPIWSKLRGIFVPRVGYRLITADYDSLEVRVAAHFSHDSNLLRIINEGVSKHDITAKALGIDRATAKTVNFGMQYHCSPFKLSKILGCSIAEGQKAWDSYWEAYSGDRAVFQACKQTVDEGNPIISPFRRRRHLPLEGLTSRQIDKVYRQAYSSLVQGTGSDLTTQGAVEIGEWLLERGIGRLWFTLHDEILIEVLEDYVTEASTKLVEVMQQPKLSVPLVAKCSGPLERWKK